VQATTQRTKGGELQFNQDLDDFLNEDSDVDGLLSGLLSEEGGRVSDGHATPLEMALRTEDSPAMREASPAATYPAFLDEALGNVPDDAGVEVQAIIVPSIGKPEPLLASNMSRRKWFKLSGAGAIGVVVGASMSSGFLGWIAGRASAAASRTSLGDAIILKGLSGNPAPVPEGGLWYVTPGEYRVSPDGAAVRDIIYEIQQGGSFVSARPKLNFQNFALADNPGSGRIDITATPTFTDVSGRLGAAQVNPDLLADTITPAQLTADVNDYSIPSAGMVRLSSDAQRTITGISSPASARFVCLRNAGSFNVVLANLNGGSLAANQIITGISADMVLPPGQAAYLVYDLTSQKWQVAS
jgi:hypothetical protein